MSHVAAIAAAAATALIAAIWQGAILAVVVALTLRLLPALSAATRSVIWTATFALLVALHFLPAAQGVGAAGGHAVGHPLHFAPALSVVLASAWLLLSMFGGVQFLVSAHRLRQINRRAVPVDAMGSIAGGRNYTLCTSADVDRPSVLGFFRPRILLPAGLLETLEPAELQQILLHETEHLRRSDDWTNLLQKLALVVFPLNPVLFWVERRMCLERELACDARVLSAGENLRKSYATTLTRLAEHSMLRRGLNLALGLLGHRPRPSELSTRVHRILTRPAATLTRTQTQLATATVLAGVLALSTTLAHAPGLVTFAPAARTEQASNSMAPASEVFAPKLVAARAVMQTRTQPAYRAVETVARMPVAPVRRLKKPQPRLRLVAPRVMTTGYRSSQMGSRQARLMLTLASVGQGQQRDQVQQFVVPAVAYVPAAYAAVRTPDGWIIFQL